MSIERRIKALPFEQSGYECFIGAVSPKDIQSMVTTDQYQDKLELYGQDNGYQRPATAAREREIANYRKTGKLFPNAVILASRDVIKYDISAGCIAINSDSTIFVVDGNHRLKGTFKAMELDKKSTPADKAKADEIGTTPIPFVLISNISKDEEMDQFIIINDTACPVEKALCNQLEVMRSEKKSLSEIDGKVVGKVICTMVANALASKPGSVWSGEIALLSNKYGQKSKGKATKGTTFITSLEGVYRYLIAVRIFQSIQTKEAQVDLLSQWITDFWSALRSINPKLFTEAESCIQKTVSYIPLHWMFIDTLRDLGQDTSLWTKDAFETHLREYKLLQDTAYWLKSGPYMTGSNFNTHKAIYNDLNDSNPARIARRAAADAAAIRASGK